MATTAPEAAGATLRGSARADRRGAQDTVAVAWLCAIPCAALTAVAILLLGPPLGRLLSPAHGYAFLDGVAGQVRPEPTEHARYLIALCAPLLATAGIVTAPRWSGRIPPRAVTATAVAVQIALAGVVVASLVGQRRIHFAVLSAERVVQAPLRIFTPATLAVAALLAGAAFAALRVPAVRSRGATALMRESRGRRLTATVLAAAFTAVWVLHAVNSDASIAAVSLEVRYHLEFTLDETFAVLDGRTPLVDFSAQYGSLSPYVIALPMLAFGKTLLTFTIVLCTIGALALLAVFDVLRRAVRSSLLALLLYLPFVATSLFFVAGTLANRSSVGTYTGNFPLRYAMPFFLACLTAYLVERRRDDLASLWGLFAVAGLAVLNNGDFGAAALGASVAALLWAAPAGGRRALLPRLAGALAGGLASAVVLVSLLTWIRAGSLPEPARIVDYARVFTLGGFALLPIPGVLGVHLLVYLTYVGAIVVATVRAVRDAGNRVLTGMLAWSGVFGLGAGMYWVGRSHPVALKYQFSAWALALMLLTAVALGALARPRVRATAVGALVVLFGFGVAVCSLAQTPTPWSQIERLQAPPAPPTGPPTAEYPSPSSDPVTRRFVASLADGPSRFVFRRGAPVAILLTTGHRVADAYGVVDVSPYTGIDSLMTVERVEAVLDALREAGGNTVILPVPLDPSILPLLERRGFEVLTASGLRRNVPGRTRPLFRPWGAGGAVMKWVDARHLHPRALR